MLKVLCVLFLANVWASVYAQKGYASQTPANCMYWCKTPENRFYCCQDDDDEPASLEEHGGKCPRTRKECPNIYKDLPTLLPDVDKIGKLYPDSPSFCAHDGICNPWEKCCFDRCFEKHVCKYAYSTNGPIQYSDRLSREKDIVQESTYHVSR